MSFVNILNVNVLDNPTHFTNPFQFEITFECIQELQDDLEWKVIYVGSAEDSSHDQVLEEVMVGPVAVGINRFVLQAEPPNPRLIANEDLIGVTVILITCSYMDHKFVQIGYYVNNEYALQYDPENYPNPVDITHLYRNILADQPRVTRYPIDWMGGGLPTGADVFDGQEEQKFAADNQNDDVIDMGEEMEEDEDDDEDEEADKDAVIDLEDEEEDDVEEDDEDDGEGEEENPSDTEMAIQEGMVFVNDDSNSIDIDRMLQK